MIRKDDILRTLGFEGLTPMQEAMDEAARAAGGTVLLSPTGSGKTLAYLLPLLGLTDAGRDALQAVVIVPTRELALQSAEMLAAMKSGMRHLCLYGGRPAMEEHRKLREARPQVVFATPGRLNDHLDKANVDTGAVALLVIDEFDKCLELGFREEMERAVTRFARARRCWLLSATRAEDIPAFMGRMTQDCQTLDFLEAAAEVSRRLRVEQVTSPQKDKLETLGRLLLTIGGEPAIVFTAHRESAERVGSYLRGMGFCAETYHGGMRQTDRERALYKYRSGAANVLVSTDLAARGIDIPETRAIIHYHLAGKREEYVHRNGRTARWEATGAVYLIVGPEETLPDYAGDIPVRELPPPTAAKPQPPRYATVYIGRGKRDKLSKGDVVGFLCKKGGLNAADIGRIDVGTDYAYAAVARTKLRQALKQMAQEKIKGMRTLVEEMRR